MGSSEFQVKISLPGLITKIAPINYFGILSAFILGWVIFGEFPVETLLPGVLFIVAAGLVIIWREKINKN